MKTKSFILTVIVMLAFTAIAFQSCKKEEENQPPTCKISSPQNGQEIKKGKTVEISVNATDNDGTITEVRFYIDGVGKGSATSFPYNYCWNTSEESKGNHTIKATAFDNNGNKTSVEISIELISGGGTAPVANFTVNPTSGTAPLIVNFSDQSTNNPTSWQWNFGDGATSTEQNPTHTYNTAGTYTIKLIATNEYGNDTETKTDYIVVSASGNAPIADFIADITNGTAPLTVNFTDQSTNSPTSWQWDFGDSGTSTQQNPAHTYNTEGTYTVTLTATNEYGNDAKTKTDYISVTGGGGGTGTFTDPRDGQTYATVDIGSQTWFAENLKYLPSVSPPSQGSEDNPYYYVYAYEGIDVSEAKERFGFHVYGVLYNWPAALTACPSGWHLPSDDEWKQMEMALGMSQSEADKTGWWRGTDEGKKMKSTSGWNYNGNGTNSSGFTALPGGYRFSNGYFDFEGNEGFWWSTTENNSNNAWYRGLIYQFERVNRYDYSKEGGFSVRCVRD